MCASGSGAGVRRGRLGTALWGCALCFMVTCSLNFVKYILEVEIGILKVKSKLALAAGAGAAWRALGASVIR